MKEIGYVNIRAAHFTIRKHGRNLLPFSVLGMGGGCRSMSCWRGNSTGQDRWLLGVCMHFHMLFPTSGMSFQSLKRNSPRIPFSLSYSLISPPELIPPSLLQPELQQVPHSVGIFACLFPLLDGHPHLCISIPEHPQILRKDFINDAGMSKWMNK